MVIRVTRIRRREDGDSHGRRVNTAGAATMSIASTKK
jgi:hypothetical protein